MKEKYIAADYPAVRDAILELVLAGKIDALDLRIIAERDCSPMPTVREVALRIGVTHPTVLTRLTKIESLIASRLP